MSTGYSENSSLRRVQTIADYQFGGNAGTALFPEGCGFLLSTTGRIRQILYGGVRLATVRASDGRLTLGIEGAKRLMACLPAPAYRVVIRDDVASFVAKGMNAFAKHVVAADPAIRAGDDVLVVAGDGRLIACGGAVVSGAEMLAFNYGVAVKVRQGSEKDASGKHQSTPDEGDDEEARHERRAD
ncbi:PUA domain-containing protein [uncultured Methanoregula sp.]|uniref:PUA domain-containing protein n=1 Tax=uncultured Methanoregula sp. TaxID=1005933 RepID=UPI002AAB36CF|nr:PUA domain-containing protein [uncultured Methanoregula sp.]